MSETPYILDEPQLELLLNITYYLTLSTFAEPLTPSEAARKLDIPANIAHYRTKRLAAAGLLEAVERHGKGRYRSVARAFLIPAELTPALHDSSLLMLDGMLGKLHRAMMTCTEQHLRDLEWVTSGKSLTLDLSGQIDLSNGEPRQYPGACRISSVELSSAQYQKLTESIIAMLEDLQGEAGEKHCTLAFIAFDAPFMR